MRIHVVWFPRVGGYVGKRGIVESSIERAVMFWLLLEAQEWADVLGGEVRSYEELATGELLADVKEPF